MSKKQRRNVSQSSTPAAATAQVRNDTTVSAGPNPTLRRQPAVFEFKPDYTNVISDLKRIGILAGSFVVILVVLSFILK